MKHKSGDLPVNNTDDSTDEWGVLNKKEGLFYVFVTFFV